MTERHALIIDDEPDITNYLVLLLADRGWEVRGATSAEEGLAMARERAPDVILLDIMMPGRGGLSTLMALRQDERLKSVPVVLVTGMDDAVHELSNHRGEGGREADGGGQESLRADAFLDKPIDPERLLSVLDEVTGAAA
jgi:CheY-like chemotaxis protein